MKEIQEDIQTNQKAVTEMGENTRRTFEEMAEAARQGKPVDFIIGLAAIYGLQFALVQQMGFLAELEIVQHDLKRRQPSIFGTEIYNCAQSGLGQMFEHANTNATDLRNEIKRFLEE